MRWVVLTDDAPPMAGGVAAFTGRVAAELLARGDDVRVFARARPGLTPDVTGVRGPSFGRRGGLWLALAAARAIRDADVVLATTWPAATTVVRFGVRPLVVAHGSDVTVPPLRPRAFERVWGRARRRLAMSAFLARALEARGHRAEVLPAPVHVAPFPVPPGSGTRWGMVARATPLKGGERFVRLVAAADVEGVVVGDGPELPAWESLARRLGARVSFVGHLDADRVQQVLTRLDLVCLMPEVHPDGSGAEGLGLAVLEAAALGVPAVGVAVGGVPEALGPGLVLSNPDDPRASARAIERWWTPSRGRDAWAWCRVTHGVARTVDALLTDR